MSRRSLRDLELDQDAIAAAQTEVYAHATEACGINLAQLASPEDLPPPTTIGPTTVPSPDTAVPETIPEDTTPVDGVTPETVPPAATTGPTDTTPTPTITG